MSARTGQGVDELVEHLVGRMPEGPAYFPPEQGSDVPEAVWVAELVREQLLDRVRDELPHSIATRVTEWEGPRHPLRDPGRAGLPEGHRDRPGRRGPADVGTAVRSQLSPGVYLELHVKVERDWQRRAAALDRLGY